MLPTVATVSPAAFGAAALLSGVSAVDVALLVVVLAGVLVGYRTGFVWQVVVIAGLIACTYVTCAYYPFVADFAASLFGEWAGTAWSIAITLVAALLLCGLTSYLLRSVISALKLQGSDRVLGAGLGAVTALVLTAMLAFVVVEVSGEGSGPAICIEESPAASAMGACVRRAMPETVRQHLRRAGSRA